MSSPDTSLQKGYIVATITVAPTSTKDFLIKVGLVTSVIVPILGLLNLFFPFAPELICRNPEVNATGSAARGLGNSVIVKMRDTTGDILYSRMYPAPEFTCQDVFGEGWTDVR